MTEREAIERALELLPQMRDSQWVTALGQVTAIYTDEAKEAFNIAIAALEFKERYDQFWEEVKAAGLRGKETEIHHSGRVFRIREVAQ